MAKGTGPLAGVKVLEFAGLGPAPFCAMMLSDMGADVIRIDRKGAAPPPKYEVTFRGREAIALDLKQPADLELCLKLIERADVLLEGFRPGVMERLGLGPEIVHARNPRLVYGRMTGWGQDGYFANEPGHDINYLAMSGALHAIGTAEKPAIPLNLVADYGGGGMYLAFGVLAALLHARESGEGQVIDCAMSDGIVSLMGQIWGHFSHGRWQDQRQSNVIDGGAHFYNTYECADGKFISVAAMEPKFYAAFLAKLEIDDPAFEAQWDQSRWPDLTARLETIFKARTRDEWCAHFEGSEACVAPVLSMVEAASHPFHKERGSFVELDGLLQPTPAPRFSKTPAKATSGVAAPSEDIAPILARWGVEES